MILPPLLVLTDRRTAQACGRDLVSTVAAAVAGGARAVLLREKDLAPHNRRMLADALRRVLAPVGGLLLVASGTGQPADGVHLAAADPFPAVTGGLVGRSCHDPDSVARATAEGCDYVTVSPVFASRSKPGHGPALGTAGLTSLVQLSGLPVFALGGVDIAGAGPCRRAGADGLAVMGALMRAADPAATCRALLAAWHLSAGVA